MSKGLEELKRLAYESACCRCQYYIDKKCTNNYECVWKTIEKELNVLEILSQYKHNIHVGKNETTGKYYVSIYYWIMDITEEEYNVIKEWLDGESDINEY